MFQTINFIIAMVLAAVQFIYFWFILSNKPINVKETDTMQSVKQIKTKFEILLLVLGFVMLIFFPFSILNELFIGIYVADIFIFFLVGAPIIISRIEKKEKLLIRNNSFNVAMQKVKNMTLKDSIIIVDEKLREAIILDDIEEIKDMHVLFKTGEKYVAGRSRDNLLKIMSKPYQDKIIKANIKGIYLEEIEGDKFKLLIKTQSSNCFSTIIEKVDLPKWIK